jgi:fatty acid-binding protein DegV
VEVLVDLMKKTETTGEVVVEDATTPGERQELAKRINAVLPRATIIHSTVSPVIGVHTGPRVMVAGAISAA